MYSEFRMSAYRRVILKLRHMLQIVMHLFERALKLSQRLMSANGS